MVGSVSSTSEGFSMGSGVDGADGTAEVAGSTWAFSWVILAWTLMRVGIIHPIDQEAPHTVPQRWEIGVLFLLRIREAQCLVNSPGPHPWASPMVIAGKWVMTPRLAWPVLMGVTTVSPVGTSTGVWSPPWFGKSGEGTFGISCWPSPVWPWAVTWVSTNSGTVECSVGEGAAKRLATVGWLLVISLLLFENISSSSTVGWSSKGAASASSSIRMSKSGILSPRHSIGPSDCKSILQVRYLL